jgi:hypothetical protein
MRLSFETLEKIKETFGDFQIEANSRKHPSEMGWIVQEFSFRFGYWDRISVSKLKSLLPGWCEVEEINIDETDEGMFLWVYSIKEKY